jgi:Flp pilus assembly protein TadD
MYYVSVNRIRPEVYGMGRKGVLAGILVVCLMVVLLASCASLTRYEAQSEFDLGLGLFNQSRYGEAVPHFQKATELEPTFAQAFLYLGRSYLNLRSYAEALPPLRTAYQLAPSDFRKAIFDVLVDALLGAALFETKKGNLGGAFDYLKETLALKPDSPRAKDDLASSLITLGNELLSKGRVSEAINAYSEVLKVTPNNSGAFLGLAQAFLKSGDFLKALEAVRKAANLDPNSREVLRLLRELPGR